MLYTNANAANIGLHIVAASTPGESAIATMYSTL